jgi:hypothetical protein
LTASKEAGKGVAKDSDAKLGTRVQAVGDMVGDKADEETYNASPLPHISTPSWAHTNSFFWQRKADVHKETAKH